MVNQYPTSICPACGHLVENVPPNADPRDLCPNCRKFKPVPESPAAPVAPKPPAELPRKPTVLDALRIAAVVECKLRCPVCSQKIEIDVAMLGVPLRCPRCGQKLEAKIV